MRSKNWINTTAGYNSSELLELRSKRISTVGSGRPTSSATKASERLPLGGDP